MAEKNKTKKITKKSAGGGSASGGKTIKASTKRSAKLKKKQTPKKSSKSVSASGGKTPIKKSTPVVPESANDVLDIFGEEEVSKEPEVTEMLEQEDVMEQVHNSAAEVDREVQREIHACTENSHSYKKKCCNVARSFLGLILVGAGVLYLLQITGWIDIVTIETWQLWPLIIVCIGLLLLSEGGWVVQFLSVLLILVVSGFVGLIFFIGAETERENDSVSREPVQGEIQENDSTSDESIDDASTDSKLARDLIVNNPSFELRSEDGTAALYDVTGEPTGLAITNTLEDGTTIPVVVAVSADETQVAFNYWDSTTAEMRIAVGDIAGENSEDVLVANAEGSTDSVILDSLEWVAEDSALQYKKVSVGCDLYCQGPEEFSTTEKTVMMDLTTGEETELEAEETEEDSEKASE